MVYVIQSLYCHLVVWILECLSLVVHGTATINWISRPSSCYDFVVSLLSFLLSPYFGYRKMKGRSYRGSPWSSCASPDESWKNEQKWFNLKEHKRKRDLRTTHFTFWITVQRFDSGLLECVQKRILCHTGVKPRWAWKSWAIKNIFPKSIEFGGYIDGFLKKNTPLESWDVNCRT